MKSFFFTGSLLFFVIAAGCGPITVPVQSDSKPRGNRLPSALLSSQTAIAVGELGTILRTTDAGATWTIQDSGTTASLTGVAFADPSVGTAVGDTILQTTDGGATWKPHYNWISAAGIWAFCCSLRGRKQWIGSRWVRNDCAHHRRRRHLDVPGLWVASRVPLKLHLCAP